MKTLKNTIAASALLIAIAGPAAAMVDSSDLRGDVRSAAGANSNVNVLVDGSTVTLTGFVEDSYALIAIEQAADAEGVDQVINNVIRTQ